MSQTTAPSRSSVAAIRNNRSAYTLIEILIVASIIVLMLGISLPVFRAITGSRSEAGATNIIASMLGRARTDAIGLQKQIGVAFVFDPARGVENMAEVEIVDCFSWSGAQPYSVGQCVKDTSGGLAVSPYYYCINPVAAGTMTAPFSSPGNWQQVGGPPIEIMLDTDLVPLPVGVGVQTLCNCNFNTSGVRISDGYLAVGVILFDAQGRMTNKTYGIAAASNLSQLAGLRQAYPFSMKVKSGSDSGVESQVGLVVFQKDAYISQKSSKPDALYLDDTPASAGAALPDYTTGSPTQKAEEDWLDKNATPLLIDRYTGTLIRGD